MTRAPVEFHIGPGIDRVIRAICVSDPISLMLSLVRSDDKLVNVLAVAAR